LLLKEIKRRKQDSEQKSNFLLSKGSFVANKDGRSH